MLRDGPNRSRALALLEGVAAGLFVALTDWLAVGPLAVRWPVACAILGAGLAGGLLAGAAGALARRRGLAAGLALGGALGVHLASIATKELGGAAALAGAALAAALFGALAGRLAARTERSRAATLGGLAALVPLAPLSWWALAGGELLPAPAGALLPRFAVAALAPAALALVVGASKGRARWGFCVALLALVAFLPRALERLADGPRASAGGPIAPAAPPPEEPRPSVLLIVIDSLRADHVGPDTPFIERLAADGLRCTQAISTASWTLPAHATLFTGTYPGDHGALEHAIRLHHRFDTLAELLRAEGYQTAAFTGGGFLAPETGLDQGFETFEPERGLNVWWRAHTPLFWRVAKNRWLPMEPLVRFVFDSGLARTERQVARWLERRDTARPFLLFLHTYEVHDYHIAHPVPDGSLPPDAPRLTARFAGRDLIPIEELLEHGTPQDFAACAALYRHRLRYADRVLGRISARIEADLAPEQLVILFTSDHGEGFDHARGRLHHGGRLHDDLLRVPLIVRAPGRVPAGAELEAQVSLIDVLPTLLELVGLSAPEGLPGRSFVAPGGFPRSEAFAEDSLAARSIAVRRADWKLVTGRGEDEAWHLSEDPAEGRSRPDDVPPELRALLDAYRAVHSGGLEDAPKATFDEAALRHLRALGYTD